MSTSSERYQSREMWHWPEFKALMNRAGLGDLPITDLVLTMSIRGPALFDLKVLATGDNRRRITPPPRIMSIGACYPKAAVTHREVPALGDWDGFGNVKSIESVPREDGRYDVMIKYMETDEVIA